MKKLLCTLACFLFLAGSALADEAIIAPSGILDTGDAFLITDTYNHALWEMDAQGEFTKVAGREGVVGADNRPMGAYHDADALEAAFDTPWAIAPYREGYAITDSANNVIRYYADEEVTTLAGSGAVGDRNATGIKATFSRPTGLCADDKGGLYVADTDNNLIRYIDKNGKVTSFAGSTEGCTEGALLQAKFSNPTGLCFDKGILYVADTGNHRICKIENSKVTTLVGGEDGYTDGSLDTATFSSPMGIAVAGDILYIADTGNSAIRTVLGDTVSTLSVSSDTSLFPVSPRGLLVDGAKLWVCDVFSHKLGSVSSTANLFTDVPGDAWYAGAVYFVKANGAMNGTSQNTFAPTGTVTRAMFAQVLHNMEGGVSVDYLMPFTDVANTWYTEAVRWAASEEIVSGTSETTYSPDSLISRQDLVLMLYRYAQWQSKDELTVTGDLSAFSDSALVSDYAKDALLWAFDSGIIKGNADGTVNPKGNATRAEVATMLQSFLALHF